MTRNDGNMSKIAKLKKNKRNYVVISISGLITQNPGRVELNVDIDRRSDCFIRFNNNADMNKCATETIEVLITCYLEPQRSFNCPHLFLNCFTNYGNLYRNFSLFQKK